MSISLMQIKFRIKSIELSRGFITHLNGRCFVQRTNNQLAAVNYRRHRSHSDQRKPKYSPLWWLRRVWQISQVQSNIQQINVSFSCVCPIIDHELRHNIVKVAVDPRGDNRVDPQTIRRLSTGFCCKMASLRASSLLISMTSWIGTRTSQLNL